MISYIHKFLNFGEKIFADIIVNLNRIIMVYGYLEFDREFRRVIPSEVGIILKKRNR